MPNLLPHFLRSVALLVLAVGILVPRVLSATEKRKTPPAPASPVEPGLFLEPMEGGEEPQPEEVGPLVVLDPGHGGGDTGTIGPSGHREKDVVLQVATRLRILLEQNGIQVALTRDSDSEVPLDDRTALANQLRADMYVSLHANASSIAGMQGPETFYLSREATEEMNRKISAIEADSYGRRGARRRRARGALEMKVWELAQSEYLEDSSAMAEAIQQQLNAVAETPQRKAKQAPITVLMGASMPAVLVEIGFLSEEEEEGLLSDPAYQQQLADRLARAIIEFGKNQQRIARTDVRP